MKRILFLLLTTSFLSSYGQDWKTRKADKQFERLEYVDAAKLYLEIAETEGDAYVYERLGDCYYNFFDPPEAEKWYAKCAPNSQDPELLFKYSEMLKANRKYELYNQMMRRFAELSPGDDRAILFMKDPDYLPNLLSSEKTSNIKNLDSINTADSEFGPAIHGDTLYFCTAQKGNKRVYGWNKEPYLDIFYSLITNDSIYSPEEELKGDVNTRYHEGTCTVSADGKTMYFTRENYFEGKFKKDESGKGTLAIFRATLKDGKWVDVRQELSVDGYSVGHPALNPKGDILYFTANIPGGKGETDIYMAYIDESGGLSAPMSAGKEINTKGREAFPFLGEDGNLYYSSDGPKSLGGYDVYVAVPNLDGTFGSPRNVGLPINSPSDDFSLALIGNGQKVVFASNRKGGKGSDDLYYTKLNSPLCKVTERVEIKDSKTKDPIENVDILISDEGGFAAGNVSTDKKGKSSFDAACRKKIILSISKLGYANKEIILEPTGDYERITSVELDPIDLIIQDGKLQLNPIYFYFDKSNITAKAAFELDKAVQVLNKYPKMKLFITTHADRRGTRAYNLALTDRRAKSTVQYLISKGIDPGRLDSKGMGEDYPVVDCSKGCTEEQHALNRRSEFIIVEQ